jgi:hypothetical protein
MVEFERIYGDRVNLFGAILGGGVCDQTRHGQGDA